MMINLADDVISAGISTALAIGISSIFFELGNRNAFKNDILEAIKYALRESSREDILLKIIQDKKKLYSIRFARKKERLKLKELEEACKSKLDNSFEKSFSEALWNRFYELIGESRTHIVSTDYGNCEELNYPEDGLSLKEYASWVDQDDEFICGEEVKGALGSFYRETICGTKDICKLLVDFDVNKIWSESEEHNKYIDANKRFDDVKEYILGL